MKTFLTGFFSILFIMNTTIAAAQVLIDQQTVLQNSNAIENGVTSTLKNFQRSQASYFARNGRYANTLSELGFGVPSILKDYGSLAILGTHSMGYTAEFVFSNVARARGYLYGDFHSFGSGCTWEFCELRCLLPSVCICKVNLTGDIPNC